MSPAFSGVSLLLSAVGWDYKTNSNFLSTQRDRTLRSIFSEGWVLLVIGETAGSCGTISIKTGLSLSTTPGLVYLHVLTCTTPAETKNVSIGNEHGCEFVCLCMCMQKIVASCGDRGSLS